MTFRDRPEFSPLVAAVRAGDGAAVSALWDLLEDCGATTADVMTLYAAPPRMPRTVVLEVGLGMQTVEPAPRWFPPDQDDSLRPVLAAWADRHGPPGRGADVRAWARDRRVPTGGARSCWYVGSAAMRASERHRAARARRALKRRVLGLWSEVRVPCPACGGPGRQVRVWHGTVHPPGTRPLRDTGSLRPSL
jgi:hypothetical protein